jgi:large subunit ribosomal protein L9
MRVILREDIPSLGKTGEVVKVADGYARNFLIPRKLAAAATAASISHIEHVRRQALKERERTLKESGALKDRLEAVSVTVTKRVGEGDRLFGSVTARDIESALVVEGIQIDRKKIRIDEPIRALGVYAVRIELPLGAEASVKVWVVAK